VSRAAAQALVETGAVRVDGAVERRGSRRVAAAAVVAVDHEPVPAASLQADPSVEVTVVHRDEHLFVVDKPADLVVHPGAGTDAPTLVHGLLALDPGLAGVGSDPDRPGIVHRLDRGTSGLLLVARTPTAHAALTASIAAHDVERTYVALVAGTVVEASGRVEAPIGRSPQRPTLQAVVADGRPAATDYEVVERFERPEPLTLLTCRLETGRTHQIRVHLAAIDHPVAGDRAYGDRTALGLERPFLHARRLELDHPVTGEHLVVDSPLPPDLVAVLDRLRSPEVDAVPPTDPAAPR
jgi:23S rRNA pseudouridine1911/1915/1917 synthase